MGGLCEAGELTGTQQVLWSEVTIVHMAKQGLSGASVMDLSLSLIPFLAIYQIQIFFLVIVSLRKKGREIYVYLGWHT